MENKLLVPDIGDFEKVEIIEILVKKGDKIKKNDPIVTLESDKSSVEVPSVSEGVVENVNVKIGDKVSKGDLLITLGSTVQSEEKSNKKTEEKIPPVTEQIIEEAEKTLVLKKEVEHYNMTELEKREKNRDFGKFIKNTKKDLKNLKHKDY